jgi:hypothetical protein
LVARAAEDEKAAGAPSLDVLIKQLDEAAKSGNSATLADLFAAPLGSDLRKINKLQDDLSAAHTELENLGRAKFGERPPAERPKVGISVVVRPASGDARRDSMKKIEEIKLKDEQSPDLAVLRITESDDVGYRSFRTLNAVRQDGVWKLAPLKPVYRQVIIGPKVTALESLLLAFRQIKRDLDSGALTSWAEVDKALEAAIRDFAKSTSVGTTIWNTRIPDVAPPFRLLGLGYEEVNVQILEALSPPMRVPDWAQRWSTRPSDPQRDIARAAPEVKRLTGLLKDTDPSARASAANELGRIGPAAETAIPALAARLDDEEMAVAEAALRALLKIARGRLR